MKFITKRIPNEIDWARLAAFIDGEGCISLSLRTEGGREYTYLHLVITNCDFSLMQWLGETFGGSVYNKPNNRSKSNWKPAFCWCAFNKQASRLLENCLPYFVMKRKQAEIAIAHQLLCVGRRSKKESPLFSQRRALRDELSSLKRVTTNRSYIRPHVLQ